MKRNTIATIATIVIASLAIGASGSYAWYFTKKQSNTVSIDTATIDIDGIKISNICIPPDRLPGDKIKINDKNELDAAMIKNKGTRRAILEIAVQPKDITGVLRSGPGVSAEAAKFPLDYSGTNYTDKRLSEVIYLTFPDLDKLTTTSPSKWKKTVDPVTKITKYYTYLEKNDKQALGDIFVILDGELGGGKKPAPGQPPSVERQFEQDSDFEVRFTVKAVQATPQAVNDYFQISSSILPTNFYE